MQCLLTFGAELAGKKLLEGAPAFPVKEGSSWMSLFLRLWAAAGAGESDGEEREIPVYASQLSDTDGDHPTHRPVPVAA